MRHGPLQYFAHPVQVEDRKRPWEYTMLFQQIRLTPVFLLTQNVSPVR